MTAVSVYGPRERLPEFRDRYAAALAEIGYRTEPCGAGLRYLNARPPAPIREKAAALAGLSMGLRVVRGDWEVSDVR